MSTIKRLLVPGALLPLGLALFLQCNNDANTADGQDMAMVDPTADMTTTGGGNEDMAGGNPGLDGPFANVDLKTSDVVLLAVSPSLVPSTAMLNGSAVTLTISGANFQTGATVSIAGTQVATTFVNSMTLTATLPAKLGTKGFVNVVVTNPDTKSASSNTLLRYYYGMLAFTLQATKVDVEAQPWAVALAQLDSGAGLDLVTANKSGNSISIAMGNNNGKFGTVKSPKSSTLGAPQPTGLTIGDMNKDGFLDIIACNEQVNNVAILKNDGAGTFTLGAEISVGSKPQGIAGFDFNGDMIFDTVSANAGGNNASLLYGAAGTMFNAATPLSDPGVSTPSPSAIAVADLNKDGKPDIVMANQMNGGVTVFLSNAAGTAFTLKGSYSAGATLPAGITIGDFVGDSNLDVAVSLNGTGYISILPGDGTGALGPFVRYSAMEAATDAPIGLANADFNADGVPDIVAALNGNTKVAVILNTNKTPAAPVLFTSGANPRAVAVGDIDSDGRIDLAVANQGDNQVSILLNSSQ